MGSVKIGDGITEVGIVHKKFRLIKRIRRFVLNFGDEFGCRVVIVNKKFGLVSFNRMR